MPSVNRRAPWPKAHIEEVIDSVAAGAATPDDVRAARATVRSLHSEIEDLGAVLKAHGPVEMRLAAEANDLRNRLTLERKLLWSTVAEELEEKLRKTASDIVHQAAAARELSGVYLFSGAGDYLAKTFFGEQCSTPRRRESQTSRKVHRQLVPPWGGFAYRPLTSMGGFSDLIHP